MKELIGYITSSYPNNNFTIDLIMSMKEAGLDRVELGIPFSDPVADGPTIEEFNHKALNNGFKIKDLFEVSNILAKELPTYWMGYMNIFYQHLDIFLQNAQKFGIKGFIIPDLPLEESLLYNDKFKSSNQNIINFIAPTTDKDRIKTIANNSKDFIYLVAYTGITGSNKEENLTQTISNIRVFYKEKIFIGFGVDEKTAKSKSKEVDGVIVGSAFIKILNDDNLNLTEKIKKVTNLTKIIKEEIN